MAVPTCSVTGDASPQREPKFATVVKWLGAVWHFAVPLLDDVTDVILLWEERRNTERRGLWWSCLFVLLVAEADRLYALLLLVYFLYAMVLSLILSVPRGLLGLLGWWSDDCTYHLAVDALWSGVGILNFGQELNMSNAWGLFSDAALWVVLGSRARSSDFVTYLGLAGREPAQFEQGRERGLRAIDLLVRHNPFRYLGAALLSWPYGHHIPGGDGGATGGAEAMTKAVGETVVVDILFFVFGIMVSDGSISFTGVAGLSSLFSLLELMNELPYYTENAVGAMRERILRLEVADGPTHEASNRSSHLVMELPGPERRASLNDRDAFSHV